MELDPSKAYYHEELFNKLHRINPEEALASIKRAIGLNPNKKSLYEDLIILLKKQIMMKKQQKLLKQFKISLKTYLIWY
ncbi:hypothetical protein [Candidatus Rickettsia colombianensi]|uniref:hypothetical protein n=1 Tax=Candidatus Rickettsia colombianensi TaxID=1090944 RepID=UPI000EF23885|nr:hypothetical protein [Candidatus Rickettsia colombianensi]